MPEYRRLIHAFWADATLREVRVRNLTESLFGTMTMAELAEALLPSGLTRPKHEQVLLAGRIAGIEFEHAVMQVARTLPPTGSEDQLARESLMSVVGTLGVPEETRNRWMRAVRIRNDAVHGEPLRRADVDRLLRAMRDALDWASGLSGRRR